jgi:hypothetical protein
MTEKLDIHFIKDKRRFNIFELEIFIELINNHINWDYILEIMELQNNDRLILNKIDKYANYIYEITKTEIQKHYRLKWIMLRTINKRWILDCFEKSFIYPIFLWLISINLMTFLAIYVLPSTLDVFTILTNQFDRNKIFLVLFQFIIGLEWGLFLLFI